MNNLMALVSDTNKLCKLLDQLANNQERCSFCPVATECKSRNRKDKDCKAAMRSWLSRDAEGTVKRASRQKAVWNDRCFAYNSGICAILNGANCDGCKFFKLPSQVEMPKINYKL